VNTATMNFNAITGEMTDMSQRKKISERYIFTTIVLTPSLLVYDISILRNLALATIFAPLCNSITC